MKRSLRIALLLAVAIAAGIGASELIYRSPSCRALIGRALGFGELVALVDGAGVYQRAPDQVSENLSALVLATNLRQGARAEVVADEAVARELDLLRHQFPSEGAFARTLRGSQISEPLLRDELAVHLRERSWIEKQIASALTVSAQECREFYERDRDRFMQPPRYRARHIFLAAHADTPTDVYLEKQEAIQALAIRLSNGEDFEMLAAEASEDEATKLRGGDLGYFSAERMAPEFITEVETLQVGQLSAAIPTTMGFHLVQLIDARPDRQLSFEEVRHEVLNTLANKKRAAAVSQLAQHLQNSAFTPR